MDLLSDAFRVLGLFEIVDKKKRQRVNPAETLLVSGFWRSGTTLLMQAISKIFNRRSIYEPLHFKTEEANRFYYKNESDRQWIPYWNDYLSDDEFFHLQEQVLKGDLKGEWVRRHREYKVAFADPLVVKMVRSNLCLPYYEKKFTSKCILLIRHPGAVLASIIRNKGGAARIKAQISRSDLVRQLLRKFENELPIDNHFDQYLDDVNARIILLYMIMNELPLYWKEAGFIHPLVITYEEMIASPLEMFYGIKDYLNIDNQTSDEEILSIWKNPSGTTKKERTDISVNERLNSWRSELDSGTEEMIYQILNNGSVFPRTRNQINQIDKLVTEN
ncbi:sulfotransferase domain-containing protein [Rhodohalobacter sp. 614A]|uniref:sulfotransferase domain-containing protein n=1 Tax=Rhodohalobacter sp. 614A TaxID=2908649 RepID=UPI001F47F63F|nr:sulfotransferase domain-containing protein [Rhodohalobacter sp. 614A]